VSEWGWLSIFNRTHALQVENVVKRMAKLCHNVVFGLTPLERSAYVLLHLPHKMFPLWLKVMEERGFTSMSPVIVMGNKTANAIRLTANPLHAHDTWYPFKMASANVSNPEAQVVTERYSSGIWRGIYKSAHKAELGISKEERTLVNDATGHAGVQVLENKETEDNKNGNFRYAVV